MNAWCMPAAYGMPPVVESAAMPENARAFTQDGDQIKLIYPDSVCVFSFTFNQIAPEGLNLEWYDAGKSTSPWNVIPLHSDPADGNTAFGTTNHTFVIEPPFWFISYSIALLANDGTKLWDSSIYLERDWQPELCWNGVLPNPVTLACTKQQDLHPVDPGYCLFHACP